MSKTFFFKKVNFKALGKNNKKTWEKTLINNLGVK